MHEIMKSDNAHVTDPMPIEQEPESAPGAKTKPSDGSGGADESGPPSPSSHKHQEQVQNSEGNCEVFNGSKGADENLIHETKAQLKEFPTVASMRFGSAGLTPSGSSGGGDGSGAPCPCPLTERVQMLKENCRHAFGFDSECKRQEWTEIEDSRWFVGVVEKLGADSCLDNGTVEIEEAPFHMGKPHLLHLAILMGDLEMVQKILETHSLSNEVHIHLRIKVDLRLFIRRLRVDNLFKASYSALDLAIAIQESEIVDALLEKNADDNNGLSGSLHLAVLYAREGEIKKTSKIIKLLVRKGLDLNFKHWWGFSAFYLAVAEGKTDIVRELLRWKGKIHLNEEFLGRRPPIQIANQEGFKDIESELMQCEDVRRFIDSAFRDRQAYVDAANAILVGAALIASVTFASWLQPPLSYTTSYHSTSMEYVDVEHNLALGLFWVFNTLSFYFAIGTVVFGAHSVLPRRQLFITKNVEKLSANLILTSLLLAFSVLFVIVAFGIAGIIVLIPILRYRWYMIAPAILGGLVCIGSIGYLFKSLWENRPWNIEKTKRDALVAEYIDFFGKKL